MNKRLEEILKRKKEIKNQLESNAEVDMDALDQELNALNEEEMQLRKRQQTAYNLQKEIESADKEENVVDDAEEVDGTETRSANKKSKMSSEVRSFLRYMMSGGRETRGVTLENGSAVVPEELDSEIIREMREVSDVIGFINLKNVKGTLRVGNMSAIDANEDKDGDEITENGGKVSTEVTFGSYRTSAKIELGVGLDYESMEEFKNTVVEELALALALKMEKQVMSGTGSSQPEGLFAADYGDQKIEVSETEFGHKTLASIKGKIRRAYGKRGSYVVNTETFHERIEGMVGSDGHPVYNESTELLLKRPVIISDEAPKDKILFGYGKRYWYNYNMAPQIASSEHEKFSSGMIVHRALAFGDGHVMDKKAFAIIDIQKVVI